MNINATLIGQMITFALLVWFTMRFVWPPLAKTMADRQQRIADGLAAAERGRHEFDIAQKRATELLHQAHEDAAEVLAQANRRATEILEQAKDDARAEGERLIAAAQAQIEHELTRAREQLRAEIAAISVAGAAKILEREIEPATHRRLLEQFIAQL